MDNEETLLGRAPVLITPACSLAQLSLAPSLADAGGLRCCSPEPPSPAPAGWTDRRRARTGPWVPLSSQGSTRAALFWPLSLWLSSWAGGGGGRLTPALCLGHSSHQHVWGIAERLCYSGDVLWPHTAGSPRGQRCRFAPVWPPRPMETPPQHAQTQLPGTWSAPHAPLSPERRGWTHVGVGTGPWSCQEVQEKSDAEAQSQGSST